MRGFRLNWRFGFSLCALNWSAESGQVPWQLHIQLGWPSFYFPLPRSSRPKDQLCMLEKYGFEYWTKPGCLFVAWGPWCRHIWAPWCWCPAGVEAQREDGSWIADFDTLGLSPAQELPAYCTTEYKYRKIGAAGARIEQTRKALVYVYRERWRRRWLWWTSRFDRIDYFIHVRIAAGKDDALPGPIDCRWMVRPGETPGQALRNMEAERVFI